MSFTRKKDLPPVAVLAKKILEEKTNQTPSQTVKRKFEVDKAKIDDMMLALSNDILPAADTIRALLSVPTATSSRNLAWARVLPLTIKLC